VQEIILKFPLPVNDSLTINCYIIIICREWGNPPTTSELITTYILGVNIRHGSGMDRWTDARSTQRPNPVWAA